MVTGTWLRCCWSSRRSCQRQPTNRVARGTGRRLSIGGEAHCPTLCRSWRAAGGLGAGRDVGLLNALDRFDPECKIGFLGHAVPTITGEMRRHFRDRRSMRVPRRLKDLQGPIGQAVAVLSSDLGRAPRSTEIAAHLGVAVEQIIEALNAQQAYACDSLDKVVGDAATTRGDLLSGVDESLATAEYRPERSH